MPSADCLALWPPPPGLPKLFQARLGEPHGPQERTRTRGATDALMLNLPNNRFVCNFEIRKTPGVGGARSGWNPNPSETSWRLGFAGSVAMFHCRHHSSSQSLQNPIPVASPLSESAPPSRSLVYWRDFLFAFEMFAVFYALFSSFVFVRGCWLHVMYTTWAAPLDRPLNTERKECELKCTSFINQQSTKREYGRVMKCE